MASGRHVDLIYENHCGEGLTERHSFLWARKRGNTVWALRTIMLAAWAVSSKGVVHEQPPQVVFSIMLQPGSTNFVNLGISVLASSWLKLPLLMWSQETSRANGANGATYPSSSSSSSSSSTIISTHNLLCWMSCFIELFPFKTITCHNVQKKFNETEFNRVQRDRCQ